MTEPSVLDFYVAASRLDLLADPVAKVIAGWVGETPSNELLVAEIDPAAADAAAMCKRYGVLLADSANCVVVAAKRGGAVSLAACVVLATTKIDVNGVVRKHLGARKASFGPVDEVVAATEMEYGGITPFGLPDGWPVLVDSRVVECERAVFGSGLRKSKLFAPGRAMRDRPDCAVVEGLAG